MVFAISFGFGAAAFVVLIFLMLLNRRPRSFGLGVLMASVLTALWAIAAGVEPWWSPGVAHALEDIRSGAWLLVLASALMVMRETEKTGTRLWVPAAVVGLAGISLANDIWLFRSATVPASFVQSQVLIRIIISVTGLLLVENLYRNTSPGRRWNAIPLCIAIGALFAYDLYVFSEAVVLHTPSVSLLAGRGIVLALVVPLLILTMARNPEWKIDIHVSRRVVFHSVTLTASGIFLLLAAAVAGLLGRLPGQWSGISEITFFCGSIIVLAVVLSTESIRSRLRRLIAENFFSTRYDYRAEWLRTVATLSPGNVQEPLRLRAIRAVADVVDSPGGALWLENDAGDYAVVQTLNLSLSPAAVEDQKSEFIAYLRSGTAISEIKDPDKPAWCRGEALWLAVPLLRIDRLVGFVVLAPPRAPAVLNWESVDLLLAIGQQVASYIEEERATRVLLESQAIIDYSRRFSFVIHDIKNVSGQLALMTANIAKFGDRPEFRADLVHGLEVAGGKLQKLIGRLRPDSLEREPIGIVNPVRIASDVARELNRNDVSVRMGSVDEISPVRMTAPDLHAVLTHLTTNAVEASCGGDEVMIVLRNERGKVLIDVMDRGPGMSADFVRNALFVPMHSTKPHGHGIGAYQARHLVRAVGGELEVESGIGRGTTVRVILPAAEEAGDALLAKAAS